MRQQRQKIALDVILLLRCWQGSWLCRVHVFEFFIVVEGKYTVS